MAKTSCKCIPKMRGCAHFLSGNCRLDGKKCIMKTDSYHYRCCPFLNSEGGHEHLETYLKEKGYTQEQIAVEFSHLPKITFESSGSSITESPTKQISLLDWRKD